MNSVRPASTFDPGPPRPVDRDRSADRPTLIFRQYFAHPAEAVWEALTDPDQLPAWAPYTADRSLARVGPVTLISIDGPERTETAATVSIAERPRLLAFDWGGQRLHWELVPDADGTELVLHHTIDRAEELSAMAAGWHLCLLAADTHLEGGRLGPVVGEAAYEYGWVDLERQYAEHLNPRSDS